MSFEPHQETRHDMGPDGRAVAGESSGDAAPVSWYLSPGYGAHLHAYELAMLPVERDIRTPASDPQQD